MARDWTYGLLATALLMASPLVAAAGFDCSQAKGSVERRICDDETLSQLDDQMAKSFAGARTRAGEHLDALLRDQRNWLADRNAAVSFSLGVGANAYQERIFFLDHLFLDPKITSPLLAAMGAHMAAMPSAANGTERLFQWWTYLGGDGKVFSRASEMNLDDTKSLPLELKDVKKLLPNEFDGLNQILMSLPSAHLGGVYVYEGSEHDMTWQLFSWHDQSVSAVQTPEVFNVPNWSGDGALAEYQGHAYAMQINVEKLAVSDLMTQEYLGDHWGKPVRLQLHYDVSLLPPNSYCAETACAELTALASQIIGRYDRSHDNDGLVENLSADAQEKFHEVQDHVKNNRDLEALPYFEGKFKYLSDDNYVVFADGTFFPIQWHGEWLLARIGYGSFGVYQVEDLLLGVWRWNGKTFAPVLGMVRRKQRGDFLLDAWLPVQTNASN